MLPYRYTQLPMTVNNFSGATSIDNKEAMSAVKKRVKKLTLITLVGGILFVIVGIVLVAVNSIEPYPNVPPNAPLPPDAESKKKSINRIRKVQIK